jgi:hypothetical protein
MKAGAVFIMTALAAAGSRSIPKQADSPKPEIELEACVVQLSHVGRDAYFQDSALYNLETNVSGKVSELSAVKRPASAAFINLDGFEACLHRWQLSPNSRYTVSFLFGNTADFVERWLVIASSESGDTVRLVLPR